MANPSSAGIYWQPVCTPAFLVLHTHNKANSLSFNQKVMLFHRTSGGTC